MRKYLIGLGAVCGAAGALAVVVLAPWLYTVRHMEAFDWLPAVFKKVQLLYCLVSYVNLGFLLVPMFAQRPRGNRCGT
jgi:hypothetical protein